jgi:hypothetical protein
VFFQRRFIKCECVLPLRPTKPATPRHWPSAKKMTNIVHESTFHFLLMETDKVELKE